MSTTDEIVDTQRFQLHKTPGLCFFHISSAQVGAVGVVHNLMTGSEMSGK